MSFQTNKPCVPCGERFADRCYHHLLTRAARPDLINDPRNLVAVCQRCHNDFLGKGLSFMAMNKNVYKFLKDNGWEYCSFSLRWRLYENNN